MNKLLCGDYVIVRTSPSEVPRFNAGPGLMSDEARSAFGAHLLDRMEKYLHQVLSPPTLGGIQYELDSAFVYLDVDGAIMVVQDGLRVVGAFPKVQNGGEIAIRFRTAFYPAPRYRNVAGNFRALGFCEQYDLWLADQGVLPPTLIARYGDKPYEYHSANPFLLTQQQIFDIGKWARDAYGRAKELGMLGPMTKINNDPTKIVLDRLTFAKIIDLAYDGAWEHGCMDFQKVPGNHPDLYSPIHINGGVSLITTAQAMDNIAKMNPFLEDENRTEAEVKSE